MDKCYMCHADIIDGVNNRSRFHIGSIAGREKFPVCDSCFDKWTDTVHSGVQSAIERGRKQELRRTDMDDLKPCPFCGSYKFRIEKYGKNKNGGYRIICDSCNAGQHSWHVYKYLAINAWNRRTYIEQLENAQTVNRWIPCSERLPEYDKDVLIYYPKWNDEPIQVAHVMQDGMCWELSDGEFNLSMKDVTHWMQLPEAPEGVD